MCQERLSSKLNKSQELGLVEGISIASGMTRMNHLLFADNCFIFIKAELHQLKNLMQILKSYEKVGGQKINLDKSDFMVSP